MTLNNKGQISYRKEKILFCCCIFLCFLLSFLINRIYPLLGDDWDYSFIWVPNYGSSDRISSLSDIIISQYEHYIHWGGRVVNHVIAQLLLALDPFWYDLLNSLVFVVLIAVIYKISATKGKINFSLLILIALGLWFLLPDFTSTVFWITYSANYLWSTVIILLFILPYLNYYKSTEKKGESFIFLVMMFFFGIIAGWTNENTSISLVFVLIAALAFFKYEKMQIPRWAIAGLIGSLIGCLFLLLAPGNYVRLDRSQEISIATRLYFFCKVYYHNLLIPFLIYIFVCFLYSRGKKDFFKSTHFKISVFFFLFAHFCALAMLASPGIPDRTMFASVCFMIIAIGILYANIDINTKTYRALKALIVAVLLIYFGIDYVSKYKYTVYLNDFWHQRELFVLEQKQKGVLDIEFKGNLNMRDDFNVYRLGNSPDDWINKIYARYYGVHSVKQGEW